MIRQRKYKKNIAKNHPGHLYRVSKFKKSKISRPSRTYYLKTARKIKKIVLIVLIFLFFAGLFYFFCFSSFFMAEKIEISRLENIEKDISDETAASFIEPFLRTRRFLFFPQRNVLFFDKRTAEQILRKNLVINQLKISLPFQIPEGFRKIKVKIEEKVPAAVLVSYDKYYYLSADGLAIKQVLSRKINKNLPLIYDQRGKKIEPREGAIDESVVSFIIGAADKFAKKFSGMKIISFEISDDKNTDLKATVSEGWQIYFDRALNLEMDKQLENLDILLKEEINDQRSNLDYVDLRLGNRVSYKVKETATKAPKGLN